jgi:hypothetical protein
VRNHGLTRLKTKLFALELHQDNVRLERHQVGYAANLGIASRYDHTAQTCITDVVVAAQPFVRAERLMFHGSQPDSSTSARATYQRGAKPDS